MTRISEATESTITVFVPLEIRRRNGRPKIVLPDDASREQDGPRDQGTEVVIRAIARAWDWRRRLEAGEIISLHDIAAAENVTSPFVSRFIRLAYLAPAVVERIISHGEASAVSLDRLAAAALSPWIEQEKLVFLGLSREGGLDHGEGPVPMDPGSKLEGRCSNPVHATKLRK